MENAEEIIPLIINKHIFQFLRGYGSMLEASHKYTVLCFEEKATVEIINSLEPRGDDKTYPERCLIFSLQLLQLEKYLTLGNVMYFESADTKNVANTVKAYIDDVIKCGYRIIATMSSGKKEIMKILKELRAVKTSDGLLKYEVGNLGTFIHMFDPSWLLMQLHKIFIMRNIKFTQDGEEKTARYKDFTECPLARDFILANRSVSSMSNAVKLFSCTLACILLPHNNSLKEADSTKMLGTSDLCHFIDGLIDTFNSSPTYVPGKPHREFCTSSSIHKLFWAEALQVFETMSTECPEVVQSNSVAESAPENNLRTRRDDTKKPKKLKARRRIFETKVTDTTKNDSLENSQKEFSQKLNIIIDALNSDPLDGISVFDNVCSKTDSVYEEVPMETESIPEEEDGFENYNVYTFKDQKRQNVTPTVAPKYCDPKIDLKDDNVADNKMSNSEPDETAEITNNLSTSEKPTKMAVSENGCESQRFDEDKENAKPFCNHQYVGSSITKSDLITMKNLRNQTTNTITYFSIGRTENGILNDNECSCVEKWKNEDNIDEDNLYCDEETEPRNGDVNAKVSTTAYCSYTDLLSKIGKVNADNTDVHTYLTPKVGKVNADNTDVHTMLTPKIGKVNADNTDVHTILTPKLDNEKKKVFEKPEYINLVPTDKPDTSTQSIKVDLKTNIIPKITEVNVNECSNTNLKPKITKVNVNECSNTNLMPKNGDTNINENTSDTILIPKTDGEKKTSVNTPKDNSWTSLGPNNRPKIKAQSIKAKLNSKLMPKISDVNANEYTTSHSNYTKFDLTKNPFVKNRKDISTLINIVPADKAKRKAQPVKAKLKTKLKPKIGAVNGNNCTTSSFSYPNQPKIGDEENAYVNEPKVVCSVLNLVPNREPEIRSEHVNTKLNTNLTPKIDDVNANEYPTGHTNLIPKIDDEENAYINARKAVDTVINFLPTVKLKPTDQSTLAESDKSKTDAVQKVGKTISDKNCAKTGAVTLDKLHMKIGAAKKLIERMSAIFDVPESEQIINLFELIMQDLPKNVCTPDELTKLKNTCKNIMNFLVPVAEKLQVAYLSRTLDAATSFEIIKTLRDCREAIVKPEVKPEMFKVDLFEMWKLTIKGMMVVTDIIFQNDDFKILNTKLFNCDTIHTKIVNVQAFNGLNPVRIVQDNSPISLNSSLEYHAFSHLCSFTVR